MDAGQKVKHDDDESSENEYSISSESNDDDMSDGECKKKEKLPIKEYQLVEQPFPPNLIKA